MAEMSLKLLVDTKENRVLFAEAGKGFADFLFYILSLPIATVIRHLTSAGMVGCIGNLYESVETLNDMYMQSTQTKDSLLKPTTPSFGGTDVPLLLPNVASSAARQLYNCGRYNCNQHVTDDSRSRCPGCNNLMTSQLNYVVPPPLSGSGSSTDPEGGFVKGVVTYMVMDDLVVKPMSTISSIAMINKLKVKDIGILEEKVVKLGVDEGVKLLKAALQSKTVLSDVFLEKMIREEQGVDVTVHQT